MFVVLVTGGLGVARRISGRSIRCLLTHDLLGDARENRGLARRGLGAGPRVLRAPGEEVGTIDPVPGVNLEAGKITRGANDARGDAGDPLELVRGVVAAGV